MHTVLLYKRVIVSDSLVFDAEREVSLPFLPFVGLRLFNTEWRPPDCDESEDWVEAILYDLKTGQVICELRADDYRPKRSGACGGGNGSGLSEGDVRRRLRGWTLTPDRDV